MKRLSNIFDVLIPRTIFSDIITALKDALGLMMQITNFSLLLALFGLVHQCFLLETAFLSQALGPTVWPRAGQLQLSTEKPCHRPYASKQTGSFMSQEDHTIQMRQLSCEI